MGEHNKHFFTKEYPVQVLRGHLASDVMVSFQGINIRAAQSSKVWGTTDTGSHASLESRPHLGYQHASLNTPSATSPQKSPKRHLGGSFTSPSPRRQPRALRPRVSNTLRLLTTSLRYGDLSASLRTLHTLCSKLA